MKTGRIIKDYLKLSFQKSNVITGIILVFLLGSALLYAGQLTSSLNIFSDGTIASASQVNTNFQLLSNAVDANRDGIACEMNTENEITGVAAPFVCESTLANYASYSGAYLFEASESGVYQIHRQILIASDTITTFINVDSSYNTLYVGGSSVTDTNQEYFFLTPGQSIELSLYHSSSGTPTAFMRSGSIVFVKRIF